MAEIKYILFDAANTLIHKPAIWDGFESVFTKNNIPFLSQELKHKHKLRSEAFHFPDRTSSDFYQKFNADLLSDLGIEPTEKLLDEIFKACTYLPWEKFSDTDVLSALPYKKGVISNFNSSLKMKLQEMFGDLFSDVIVSEEEGIAKPQLKFYELAVKNIGLNPKNILYIGDSIRLDIEPAEKVGINSLLIDRDNVYPSFKKRINSLRELEQFL
jgi:HAD superfamily hydrolase (TIGR01549 family)